jgi:hypothetical protein
VNRLALGALAVLALGAASAQSATKAPSAEGGSVVASVSYVKKNEVYKELRLKIVRAGSTVLDSPVERLGCRGCDAFRPVAVRVRDLDGGDPEVLLELNTQGAHCCTVVLALRYAPAAHTYWAKLLFFGNYGYRLADLDHDRLPEIVAFDERFVYAFSAYVFSAAPPRIWQYRQGRLLDVTRRFPDEIRRNATQVGKEFLTKRRPPKDTDLRTYVAVYVADQYLLDRPAEGKRALDYALGHGLLYSGKEHLGTPAGRNFVAVLLRDLRRWGYL